MTWTTPRTTARPQRDSNFRWNVMVFMGVNTPDSERDLTKEAEENIRQMEPDPGVDSSKLNVLVQRHTPDGAIRQQIGKPDTKKDLPITPEDATNGAALRDFLEWAYDAAQHRAQDRTLLVLWGHSYDFAIARAETPTGIDGLDFAELGGILREFSQSHQTRFDIVAFDACQVSTIEMAYELRDVADYLLSSQIGIPIPGWPYKRIFDRIRVPKDTLMGAAELGSYIVRRYCEHYRAENKTVTLTLLDLQHAEEVFNQVNALARRLAILLDDAPDRIAELMSRSRTIEGEPFIDVADFCLNVFREAGDRSLKNAALRLGDKLLSAGPAEDGGSLEGKGRPFVAEHGRNACETARLHGVSLYAPHVAPQHDIEDGREAYNAFAFVDRNFWPEFARDPRLV